MEPTLSIVVPTYNAQAFIGETIASAFKQTVQPFEVVVVDDASTDATCSIVNSLAKDAPFPLRLIALRENSGGPVVPMNCGVSAADGLLFTILDHDDLLANEAVESYLDGWCRSKSATVGMVTADLASFNSDAVIYSSHFRRPSGLWGFDGAMVPSAFIELTSHDARRLLCTSMCLPAKAAFPKDVWMRVGKFDPSYRSAWDSAFVWAVTRSFTVSVVDKVLVHVRQHTGSLSANNALVTAELIDLYRRMAREVDDPKLRAVIRLRIENELFEQAYSAYKRHSVRELLPAAAGLALSRARRLMSSHRPRHEHKVA